MIRVRLPFHLQTLAGVGSEIQLELDQPPTLGHLLDALERTYPMLRGTVRDHASGKRRPMIRFFACARDLSLEPAETPLPEAVSTGKEAFMIVGAIAGGEA